MPRRECLDCRTLIGSGSRCPACETAKQRSIEARRHRGTTTSRGLGWSHQQAARVILAGDPACYWCGEPATTADHLVPRSHGGHNDLSNYVPACKPCNDARADRLRPPRRVARPR
ncbi:MAG: HNH endonuclease [Nocardioidaceae bacterium]